jgi:hypothetical protein
MSEEKIVYILNANILRYKFFAFLFFKEQDVLASLTLVHKPTIFLLPFIVLTHDKTLSKNNLEVNL